MTAAAAVIASGHWALVADCEADETFIWCAKMPAAAFKTTAFRIATTVGFCCVGSKAAMSFSAFSTASPPLSNSLFAKGILNSVGSKTCFSNIFFPNCQIVEVVVIVI